MKGSIDIDIGGTFTDCYVTVDGRAEWCKTRTTTFDLGKGMVEAISEAANRLGMESQDLLGRTGIIRYSTTLALNTLLEAKGPRLGYITTEGFDDNLLVGRASQWQDGKTIKEMRNIARAAKPRPLIPREHMIGARERMDYRGRVVRPLDEEDFLAKLDHLVDQGVRGFVVCLLWSHLNPAHERRIRELIELEYGESYLGNTPVFLSSSNSPRRLEYTRATTTLLNAYLHQSMYEELGGISRRLRTGGYAEPLMMVHNTGGMASVFRSSAIQTFSGGPVAGLMGSSHLGRAYGFDNVVVTDMGGTSFDIGMIVQGSTRFYQIAPTIDQWLVDVTMLDTRSIGAGGGSIARINHDLGGRLEVGPESSGSMPGPASYDQGGRDATVTDADVVLGYVDPTTFDGGRTPLNVRRARRALRDAVATPLDLSIEDAAMLVKRIIDEQMGAVIHKETVLKGYDPRDFVVFSGGGAGPVHCCGYAEAAGMRTAVVFPFSPVFCAYGSSTMDVLHVYERSHNFQLLNGITKEWMETYDVFNEIVTELKARASRDFLGEGFSLDDVTFSLELDMKFGGQLNVKRVASPVLEMSSVEDAKRIYAAFEQEYSEAYSALGLNPEAGVEIDALVLKARIPQTGSDDTMEEPAPIPACPPTGSRDAIWGLGEDARPTDVYATESLLPGMQLSGPAFVDGESTTVVVAPGWTLRVDGHRAFILTHDQEDPA